MDAGGLWVITVYCDGDMTGAIDECLDPFTHSSGRFEIDGGPHWRVEGYTADQPDKALIHDAVALVASVFGRAMPKVTIAPLEQRDWVAESLKNFPPLQVGRFYIHGSHITDAPPLGSRSIRLDAGAAFGTGDHATTTGCLLALQELAKTVRPKKVLDMGTGTGILAMAAAMLWPAQIMAADIDPVSVRVATKNLHDNQLHRAVRVVQASGFASPAVRQAGPFDLIAANILSRPLITMAPAMRAMTADGGRVVLSGLLSRDGLRVQRAYEAQRFRLIAARDIKDWRTLVLGLAPRRDAEEMEVEYDDL